MDLPVANIKDMTVTLQVDVPAQQAFTSPAQDTLLSIEMCFVSQRVDYSVKKNSDNSNAI